MTGDGVNDVLALRDADIGVAMGSGSPASRAAADLVLLDSAFAGLPSVVGEGRRVLANIERCATLFLTKTVYALLLAVGVGLASLPFPFLPRHLTLISTLTIGIPGFVLTLAPNSRRAQTGFTRRVLGRAAPAGILAAAATFAIFVVVRNGLGAGLPQARTAATMVLCAMGFVIVWRIAQPFTFERTLMMAVLIGVLVASIVLPPLRDFFALTIPRWSVLGVSIPIGIVFGAGLSRLPLSDHDATAA
jgi:magnesium-transporting ATPase (P-type)